MLPVASMIQQRTWGAVRCTAVSPFLLTEVNDVVAGWLGQPVATIRGQPLAEALPQARGEWLAAIVRALTSGESAQVRHFTAAWPDGEERSFAISCVPIFEQNDDRAASILSLLVEQNQAASHEVVTEAHLSQLGDLFALLPIPIWLFDARGRLQYANRATQQLFEVSSFEGLVALVGRTASAQFTTLQPRITSASMIAEVAEAGTREIDKLAERDTIDLSAVRWVGDRRRARAQTPRPSELAALRALHRRAVTTNQIVSLVHPRTNTEIIVESSAAPILNAAGHLVGAIALTLDITDRILLQGQRDAVLSMLGHELRNPLTPSLFLLQKLHKTLKQEGDFTSEVADIDKILAQWNRILQISNDIDAMVVTMHNSQGSERLISDLVQICHELAIEQEKRRPQTPVIVETNQDAILGIFARKQLERALTSLLASAARRSPPGKPVTVRLRAQADKVKIEIRDHGKPFDPDQLTAIRQVLGRGGAALGMTDGTDLDLAIVQTILSLYRTQLLVNSSPRQGTIFWFTLPLPPIEGQ